MRPSTFTSMAASSTPRRRGTRRCIGPTCPPPSYRNRTFRCGSDGIITIKSGGRLGNQMGEHATLLALAWRDQLFPILQHRFLLSPLFSVHSCPELDEIPSRFLRSNSTLIRKTRSKLGWLGFHKVRGRVLTWLSLTVLVEPWVT